MTPEGHSWRSLAGAEGHTALLCPLEPHKPAFPIAFSSSFHGVVGIMSDHPGASQVGNLYRERGVESSTSVLATPVWSPPPGLTDTARNALVKAINRVPPAWLLPPQDGELFDRSAEVYARLQGYALFIGFAVVGRSDSTSLRKNYLCIHHEDKT